MHYRDRSDELALWNGKENHDGKEAYELMAPHPRPSPRLQFETTWKIRGGARGEYRGDVGRLQL